VKPLGVVVPLASALKVRQELSVRAASAHLRSSEVRSRRFTPGYLLPAAAAASPLAARDKYKTGRESFAGVATGFLKTLAASGLTQLLFTLPKLSRSRSGHQTQQVQ